MEQEVDKQLSSDIIKLIHAELDNVGVDDIFHINSRYKHSPTTVYKEELESNIDGKILTDVTYVSYSLKFEDGEPSINIGTIVETKETKVPYKTIRKWLKTIQLYTTRKEFIQTTHITCGHIHFILTDEERSDLINKTESAYKTHLKLLNLNRDKNVFDKINLRLAKF